MLRFRNKRIQTVSNNEMIHYYSLEKHEINALHSLVDFAENLSAKGFKLDSSFQSAYDACLVMYQRTGVPSFSYLERLYGEIIPIYYNNKWQGHIMAESPKKLELALHWVGQMNANADELQSALIDLKMIES
ncbi:TPA: hypothetical protein TZY59_000967 [Streptococcus suis]|nr:hypothetical protein [Streptococcus suis]